MRWTNVVLFAAAALAVAGCETQRKTEVAKPERAARAFTRPHQLDPGLNWAGQALPTGDLETSVITLEKIAPDDLAPNSDLDYTIRVRNISPTTTLTDVVVSDKLPGEGYTFRGAYPKAERKGDSLVWDLGRMPPGTSHEITVQGHVGTSLEGGLCCATVTYGPRPVAPTVQPKPAEAPKPVAPKPAPPPPPVAVLALVKTAPAEACLFDEIPIRLVVQNTGKAKATDVKVVDQLPEGWTVNGKPTVTFDVGTLDAGASKELTAKAKASRTGKFANRATATAAGGLSAQASSETVVRQAKLEITKTASAQTLILGREATFTMTVKNSGDWPAADTTITDTMTGADAIRSASEGGSITGSTVVWKLGSLAPGASRTVTAKATRNTPGAIENTAKATGGCSQPVSAAARVAYIGVPAILLEVVDSPDPVTVGGTVIYTITVTNQGSAADSDIAVVATIEPGVEFVNGGGPTAATMKDGKVTFAPLASLAPKQTVNWTVTVRGTKAADTRFRVELNTRETQRPIEETEATRFYE